MIKHAFALLAGATLWLGAPAYAQSADSSVKTVQLSKVILDTESAEIKGKLKGGTLCVFPQKLPVIKEKKTQDYERYDQLFSEKMRNTGFKVVTTSADLFAADDDKNKADYLVGVTVRPDTLNVCSSVNGEKGDVTLAVEWVVYDRAMEKVVLTQSAIGHGVQEKFSRDGLKGMWNRAFLESLSTLIAQGAFDTYLGKPAPQAAGTQ